uniref:Uncharacterized protein n=1 Tax=Physcomitrium patens TaxID=3218 RepID=A0A7I3Z2J1_PHYPA
MVTWGRRVRQRACQFEVMSCHAARARFRTPHTDAVCKCRWEGRRVAVAVAVAGNCSSYR